MANDPNEQENLNTHHDDHDEAHAEITKWERRWLSLSALISLTFVAFIAYSLVIEGAHIAQSQERATPDQLLSQEIFTQPGVVELSPGNFQVSVVAQAYSFNPPEIRLPAGAATTFYMTSRDVLHGFQIEDTNVNVELIPGELSTFQYTFDRPGEYRVACNEYCGVGHHNMITKLVVLETEEYQEELEIAEARLVQAQMSNESWRVDGEAVYTSNCIGCHQANGAGIAGAFPPLPEHTVDLFEAEGGREYLANLQLYGLQGPIEVLGSTYNGNMPAWKQLSDDDIADVLNYVLHTWGNDELLPEDFEVYAAEEITALRDQDLSADDMYAQRQDLGLE